MKYPGSKFKQCSASMYIVSMTVTYCILETSLHNNCSESKKGTGPPVKFKTILAKTFYLEEHMVLFL